MPSRHFAAHGAEKMLYDWRMQPQAVVLGERLYVVYFANEHAKPGHPHIVWCDLPSGRWSEPLRLAAPEVADHHFAPILWIGQDNRLHVIHHCHRTPAVHLVSVRPDDPGEWREGPAIADSMSYPTVWKMPGGTLVLVYRVEGHLGYWVQRESGNDGETWSEPRVITDFDFAPRDETDRWAGSYLSTLPGAGTSLHVGFVHWEERDNVNPRYHAFSRDLYSRYNLYYLRADWRTGQLETIRGEPLSSPVNRVAAEACKILDSGYELTNFPSIATDAHDRPLFIAPVSDGSPWNCWFTCLRWDGDAWQHSRLCRTDNIWNASLVWYEAGSRFRAWLVEGEGKDESCFYGGGRLALWESEDAGRTWRRLHYLEPHAGLLYNNPKRVFTADGRPVKDWMVFFGWQGPQSMWKVDTPTPNRGLAFLYADGRIRGRGDGA